MRLFVVWNAIDEYVFVERGTWNVEGRGIGGGAV